MDVQRRRTDSAIRRAWKHASSNPFISTVAFAALVHSTWAFGTLFSGAQPVVDADMQMQGGAWMQQTIRLALWLVPAFALAFSVDVGLLSTAYDIRTGKSNRWKMATFGLLCISSYYLQWTYISSHMPVAPLADGVAAYLRDFAQGLRDAAVYVIPALLPTTILFYTFGDTRPVEQDAPSGMHTSAARDVGMQTLSHHVTLSVQPPASLDAPQPPALPASARQSPRGAYNGDAARMVHQVNDGSFTVHCADCGWERSGYATMDSAVKSASGHIGRWCKVRHAQVIEVE